MMQIYPLSRKITLTLTLFLPLLLIALGIFLSANPPLSQAASPSGGQWFVDRLDDPALPEGSACTDAPNDCSLRGAVSAYNSGDVIAFTITGTIHLGNGEMIIDNGDLTIQGPGPNDLIISAGNASRIFLIGEGLQINISGVTLRDGFADQGGAIFNNRSALVLDDCVLSNNTAEAFGGAIHNTAAVPSNQHTELKSGGALTATLQINNCILENNAASGTSEEEPIGIGGAIYNTALGTGATAAVTITHSTLISNTADDDFYAGGAITNFAFNNSGIGSANATVHIADSTLTGNTASLGDGGAIVNYALDKGAAATLTVIRSTLNTNVSNSDFGGGGSIFNYAYNRDVDGLATATVHVEASTLNGNMAPADRGGAIFNGALDSGSTAMLHILNSTFSGNQAAAAGGAIASETYNRDSFGETNATVNITHASFVGNTASNGAAISNDPVNVLGTVTVVYLKNSLLYNNTVEDCLNGGLIEGANNLIDDDTCGADTSFHLGAANQVSLDLQNNGGPTLTHALLAGSNAEDAVPDGDCTLVNAMTVVAEDQRGEPHPLGAACDVGAVEGTLEENMFIYLPLIIK